MPTPAEIRFARLRAYAQAMAPLLDEHSYYQLLEIDPGADFGAVRAAFYRVAGDLHPDRYHTMPDTETREQLATIYARISEGYRVLSSPDKRAAYDKGLGEGKKRYLSSDRERKGPQSPEDAIAHLDAKKFFRLAMIAMGRKDWKGAVMNLRFARNFDGASELIRTELEAAEVALKTFGK